jgi:transketolase
MNYIKDSGDFTRDNPGGRNIRFGIREHGMCAILKRRLLPRYFRGLGCDLPCFLRYGPALDSTRSAGAIAEHLHFHARLNRRGGKTVRPINRSRR